MSRKNIFIWTFLVLLLFVLPFQPATAQEALYIEAVYPEQGSRGEVIDMLVRGAGFESRQALNGILLNGQEIPVLDWAILSDDAVKVQFLIPEDTEPRETEIRFIFDDTALDAFFIVTEGGDAPFIDEFSPHEGQIDTEVPISFAVSNYFLGEFGGITIGYEEIPVLDYNSSNSTEAWEFRTYLPTYLPPGDFIINLYFQTYTFSSDFFVSTSPIDEPASPSVYGYNPNDAQMETDVEFILYGFALPELGELLGINVGNFDLPINYYEVISEEAAAAGTYFPPEAPTGENRIIFTFENYRYTDTIFIHEPEVGFDAPILSSLRPQKATQDSDITLQLEGENLDNLGELVDVRIGQFRLEDIDYDYESSSEVSVYLYLPGNTPPGEQIITVSFENAEIREDFTVTEGIDWSLWLVLLAVIAGLGATGVVIGGGYAVAKAIRKKPEPRDDPHKPQPDLHFNVRVDPGIQTIETGRRPLTGDQEFHFEATGDPGEQTIEPDDDSLVDEA